MRMGPDIMASLAPMDTIPALTTLIKPIPTASMGKLIDAITRLTVVIATAGNSDGERRARSPSVARADSKHSAMG